MLSIGELSKKIGISTQTIRYYERIGLLPKPQRSSNGYRAYDDTDIERLEFIKRSRSLDFSLDDIQEILAFRERGEPPCLYVLQIMQEQINNIEKRIADLQRLQDELHLIHETGKHLPPDVQMKACICHLIKIGIAD
jgi:DNA-binding transcriptional MerR regulator